MTNATFDGLSRLALVSAPSRATVAFDALCRELLVSTPGVIAVNFSGLVREILGMAPGGVAAIASPASLWKSFGPIPIFPPLPQGFPVKVSAVLDTTLATTKSLREIRVAQQQSPLWDIELLFEELRDQTQNQVPYQPFVLPIVYQEYEELVSTWLSMYGQTGVFAFDCPWDDSRSNQLIGVGDGQTYAFSICRTWGLGAQATTAPVSLVNTVMAVMVNGIVVPSSRYYVNRNTLYFVDAKGFFYPPAAGLAVTMTFSYYYLCRFIEDEQDFEEFGKNRWTVPSLKFRAVLWQ